MPFRFQITVCVFSTNMLVKSSIIFTFFCIIILNDAFHTSLLTRRVSDLDRLQPTSKNIEERPYESLEGEGNDKQAKRASEFLPFLARRMQPSQSSQTSQPPSPQPYLQAPVRQQLEKQQLRDRHQQQIQQSLKQQQQLQFEAQEQSQGQQHEYG